jgi:hypothetical protein
MKIHTRMLQKPLFRGFVFVNVEIVERDLKFADRIGLDDIVHEVKESTVVRRSRA